MTYESKVDLTINDVAATVTIKIPGGVEIHLRTPARVMRGAASHAHVVIKAHDTRVAKHDLARVLEQLGEVGRMALERAIGNERENRGGQ